MNCNEFKKYMNDYIDVTISDGLKSEMNEHLKTCQACRDELEFMQSVIHTMHSMPEISVPDDFIDKLNERIDEKEKTKAPSHLKLKGFLNWKTYSTLAACVLLVVLVKVDINSLIPKIYEPTNEDSIVLYDKSYSEPTSDSEDNVFSSSETATPSVSNEEHQNLSSVQTESEDKTTSDAVIKSDISSHTSNPIYAQIAPQDSELTRTIEEQPTENTPPTQTTQPQSTDVTESISETPTMSLKMSSVPEPTASADETPSSGGGGSSSSGSLASFSACVPLPSPTQPAVSAISYELSVDKGDIDNVKKILTENSASECDGYYQLTSNNANNFFNQLHKKNIKFLKTLKENSNTEDADYINIYLVAK